MTVIIDRRSGTTVKSSHPQVISFSATIATLQAGLVEKLLDWAVTRADNRLMLNIDDTSLTISYVGVGVDFRDLRGGPFGAPKNTDVTVVRLCDCPDTVTTCLLERYKAYRLVMWKTVEWEQSQYIAPPIPIPNPTPVPTTNPTPDPTTNPTPTTDPTTTPTPTTPSV